MIMTTVVMMMMTTRMIGMKFVYIVEGRRLLFRHTEVTIYVATTYLNFVDSFHV
jgi:hypothetical protein